MKNTTTEKPMQPNTSAITNPRDLHSWINSCAGILESRPVTVTLFGKTFSAVWYRQEMTPPDGAPNQSRYVREMIYVTSNRPQAARKPRICYTVPNDAREWYVAGYIDSKDIKPEFAHYHPFGGNFLLAPWDTKDFPEGSKNDKIDTYEPRPYTRVPLEIHNATSN